jgi:dTDP-glucose pyrophosphorylase
LQNYKRHIASIDISVREALKLLDELAPDAILFLVSSENILVGSLTDGDLRRGLIGGLGLDEHLNHFIKKEPKYILDGKYDLKEIIQLRLEDILIIPIVDSDHRIINIVNFRERKSYLPVDAVLMAGGKGERLKPLTDNTPKPLLTVGSKPIIEHNIDRLNNYGIIDVWISIRYLGKQIQDFLGDGGQKFMRIKYAVEQEALGTAGALSLIGDFVHDTILVMNSDLLTNIDFENFYLFFKNEDADLAVACIPFEVKVPYAVMETKGNQVVGFKEKPTYTHYSNAGIYLMKRSVLDQIPTNTHFNATDLMDKLIESGKKVVSYPLIGYWLDIGKHEDYQKAQLDIKSITL